MKKLIIPFLAFCLFSNELFSQDVKPSNSEEKKGIALGLQLGTLGVGLDFVYPLSKQINVRLNGSFLPIKYKNSFEEEKNVLTDNELSVKLLTAGLMFDLMPSKSLEGFRFSAGIFYNGSKYQIHRIYTYDDGAIKEDLGTLTIKAIYPKVNPYLGMVFGKFKGSRKLNVFFEMGVLYLGKPKIDFTGTGRVAPTAEQAPIIEENMKGYNWMPNINLHFNYTIK